MKIHNETGHQRQDLESSGLTLDRSDDPSELRDYYRIVQREYLDRFDVYFSVDDRLDLRERQKFDVFVLKRSGKVIGGFELHCPTIWNGYSIPCLEYVREDTNPGIEKELPTSGEISKLVISKQKKTIQDVHYLLSRAGEICFSSSLEKLYVFAPKFHTYLYRKIIQSGTLASFSSFVLHEFEYSNGCSEMTFYLSEFRRENKYVLSRKIPV